MANRGKTRQIEDVIRSKIVVEIGVFYYRCPFVTLGDLECKGVGAGRTIINTFPMSEATPETLKKNL